MSIVSLKELKALLPKGKRLLGIDHSRRAWGLALADPDLTVATPLTVLRAGKFSANLPPLASLCKEYGVGGLVLGLPLNMDGSEGPRAQSVRHFADNLLQARDSLGFAPLIAFCDERLSTAAAHSLLDEHHDLRPGRRRAALDQLAAQLILQAALKEMARSPPR